VRVQSRANPTGVRTYTLVSRHSRAATAGVALLFSLLAIVVTWPLCLHLGTKVIGPFLGDNLEYVWKIWWVKHALMDLGQSPLVQPDIYYPFGYQLAYGEITPIHTYLGIPSTALVGPTATYNLFILASISLSGFFTYLFVYEWTGNRSAGIVAGFVFAFCPYRMARIAGHLPLVDTQWLPLFFLFLERFIDRHRRANAALIGLFFAASTLSSWYYGLALGILTPVYLIARLGGKRLAKEWRLWMRGGLAFATVAAVLIVPFLLPYLDVQQTGAATIPLEQTAFWSASLTDYLTPNPRHVLWGDWVQKRLTPFPEELPYEFIIGWGLFPSVLALYCWRRRRARLGRAWGWWTAAALLFSLGPVLKLFGGIVTLPAPAGVATAFNNTLEWLGQHSLASETYSLAPAGRIAIPLPALILRWYLPVLSGLRSWARFAVFAAFGVAAMAGAGTATFLETEVERFSSRRPALRRWGVTAMLAGLIFFESFTGPQQLITPGPRPVDEWLAALPERTTIIQMPLAAALSGPQMYYTMHHGQRIASGYGTYLPILIEKRYPELLAFPADESLDVLVGWGGTGVEMVLIDEADVPASDPLWTAIHNQSRLELVIEVDGVWVFKVQ